MISFKFRCPNRFIQLLSRRDVHSSLVTCSPIKSPLYILRQKTGLAYNLCREALDKHENNVDMAEAWLKAQALAHGLQKATKVRDRSAKEGLIGLALRRDWKQATFLELNCETDFVAKNQLFKDFAMSLLEQVASNTSDCERENSNGQDFVEKLRLSEAAYRNIEEQIAPLITRLAENIRVRRAYHFKVSHEETRIFSQIHALSGRNESENLDIKIGRFGAVVALRSLATDSLSKNTLTPSIGNRLCQHVIGFSPTYIELPENIRAHLEEAEKEAAERAAADRPKEGVVEEQLSDLEDNETVSNSRDDWPSMMDQTLILSDEITVRDYCDSNQLSVVFFDRFECGEVS